MRRDRAASVASAECEASTRRGAFAAAERGTRSRHGVHPAAERGGRGREASPRELPTARLRVHVHVRWTSSGRAPLRQARLRQPARPAAGGAAQDLLAPQVQGGRPPAHGEMSLFVLASSSLCLFFLPMSAERKAETMGNAEAEFSFSAGLFLLKK